jgi:hypothetical protein
MMSESQGGWESHSTSTVPMIKPGKRAARRLKPIEVVPSSCHISVCIPAFAVHPGVLMAEELLQVGEDEFTMEQRLSHRENGYFSVLNSSDYNYVRCCLPTALMPKPPDPSDRKVSKRSWEKLTQNWRRSLIKLRREIGSGWQ